MNQKDLALFATSTIETMARFGMSEELKQKQEEVARLSAIKILKQVISDLENNKSLDRYEWVYYGEDNYLLNLTPGLKEPYTLEDFANI